MLGSSPAAAKAIAGRQAVRHSALDAALESLPRTFDTVITHPALGCSQVVRHRPLEATFVGSNPTAPGAYAWTKSAG